jgi:RimJ/RimL family protein N-acetyltransferase
MSNAESAPPALPDPTSRIEFRFWSQCDPDLAWQLWGDPLVSQFVGGPFSPQKVALRLARHLGYELELGYQYWPLFLREPSPLGKSGEFVGCCGLKPCKYAQANIEHGFYLRPGFHGQGLGFEAARAALAFGFGRLGAGSIFAGHHPRNTASRALLQKLGFRYAFDEFYEPTGVDHPGYFLSLETWSSHPWTKK